MSPDGQSVNQLFSTNALLYTPASLVQFDCVTVACLSCTVMPSPATTGRLTSARYDYRSLTLNRGLSNDGC